MLVCIIFDRLYNSVLLAVDSVSLSRVFDTVSSPFVFAVGVVCCLFSFGSLVDVTVNFFRIVPPKINLAIHKIISSYF